MGSESYHLTNRTCESIRNPAHIWSIGPSNSPGHSFGLASWRIFEKHPFSLQDPSHCIGSCIHLTSKKESTHHCKKAILRETCSILPTITQKKHKKSFWERSNLVPIILHDLWWRLHHYHLHLWMLSGHSWVLQVRHFKITKSLNLLSGTWFIGKFLTSHECCCHYISL